MISRTNLPGLLLGLSLLMGLLPARGQTRPAASEPQAQVLAGGYGNHADGPGPTARFSFPTGVARGTDGVLCIANTENNRILMVW